MSSQDSWELLGLRDRGQEWPRAWLEGAQDSSEACVENSVLDPSAQLQPGHFPTLWGSLAKMSQSPCPS